MYRLSRSEPFDALEIVATVQDEFNWNLTFYLPTSTYCSGCIESGQPRTKMPVHGNVFWEAESTCAYAGLVLQVKPSKAECSQRFNNLGRIKRLVLCQDQCCRPAQGKNDFQTATDLQINLLYVKFDGDPETALYCNVLQCIAGRRHGQGGLCDSNVLPGSYNTPWP